MVVYLLKGQTQLTEIENIPFKSTQNNDADKSHKILEITSEQKPGELYKSIADGKIYYSTKSDPGFQISDPEY